MFEIKIGKTVGRLTCVAAVDRKHWTDRGEESTEERGGVGEWDRWLTLKCACGKIFETWDSKMPNKEADWPQDCGCGIATVEEKRIPHRGRPPIELRRKRLMQAFSLSIDAITKVSEIAYREQVSLSSVCERMIQAYREEGEHEK